MSAPTSRRARTVHLESVLYPGEGVDVTADDTDGRVTIRTWRGPLSGVGTAVTLSGAERLALMRALAFPGAPTDEPRGVIEDEDDGLVAVSVPLLPVENLRDRPHYRSGGW